MKATEKQELARKRNWALYQLKGAKGNIVRSMQQAGVGTAVVEMYLDAWMEDVRREYFLRCSEIDQRNKDK